MKMKKSHSLFNLKNKVPVHALVNEMRACHTNNSPVGIATQKENLRQWIEINLAAKRHERFFNASTDLIKVVARACDYDNINSFTKDDLPTFNRDMYHLTGINYAGMIK